MRAVLLALLLSVRPAPAQESIPPSETAPLGVVDTILVSGNAKTETYVILDEMTLRAGSLVTREALAFDRARIYSLGLFTRVDIQYDSLGGKRLLLVDVNERWYLYPFPIIGFRDGDPKRLYYGAGLLHNNVSGRNQKLAASIVLGNDPGAAVAFADPLFDREDRLSLSGSIAFSRVRNRSALESAVTGDFQERHYSFSGSIGKRTSLYSFVGLSIGFRSVVVSDFRRGRTVSSNGRDEFFTIALNALYDTRDLAEYATRGVSLSASVTKDGFGESTLDVTRFAADARGYVPVGELTFAGRAYGALNAGGPLPTYLREYVGYAEKIRGYYTDVMEGENSMGGTLELRWNLLPPRTFILQRLPVPMEFKVWRFGMSLAVFSDAGATWFRRDGLRRTDFVAGYGGGVHFLLPYSFVARVECAWNDRARRQFILDLRGSI
jgi:outer membrane protein assembly factor BamA